MQNMKFQLLFTGEKKLEIFKNLKLHINSVYKIKVTINKKILSLINKILIQF